MRKVCIVLLSIVVIMAFVLPVSAADVKFSGSYVAQGYYDNNRSLTTGTNAGPSVSNVWQRLRVQTDFQVQEGLKLTTRFDAMEKIWGAPRSTTATALNLAGNDQESENIKFTHAFVTFNIPGDVGALMVGYMTQGTWGTAFGDTGEQDYGMRVKWDWTTGSYFWGARWDKTEGKKYYSSAGPAAAAGVAGSTYATDQDSEKDSVLGGYRWSKGDAGLQITYYLDTTNDNFSSGPASAATGYKAKYWLFQPYARATFGMVYMETEFGFYTGKYKEYDVPSTTRVNSDYQGWRGYIMANIDLAPAYVGALAFYTAGDDLGTTDKYEGGVKIGTDFAPCLILFNYDLGRWNGLLGGKNGLTSTNFPAYNNDNVGAVQIFAGMKPIPKLDLKASYTVAQADKDGSSVNWQSKNIGSELDLTATYKIYDNLSYMVGFAYLWAGDWFKGTSTSAQIDNDYLLTHKLTLTF
ncbi:MAG: hypothetical protein L7F78_02750 [Syntrophales bacterium LBB04]|nr:hypothetical protein [Syntrophales bacterium LBB04]